MADYSKLSDQYLADLLKVGDREAFTELYNRYSVILFYKVNQMLRDEDSSRDIVQDLFIGLWEKASLIRSDQNIAGYLYVSARNKVLKYVQRSTLKNNYISSLAAYVSEADLDTLQGIDERDLSKLIQQEIERLPPKMKIVFEMSRNDDLSHAEIASKLGISALTVKKHVNNALKILRSKIGSHLPVALVAIELTKRMQD